VRLRNSYIIEADDCIKDSEGNVTEVKARVIENTVGNDPEDGIKAKGVIHWVDAKEHAVFDVNVYDRLFTDPAPDSGDKNFLDSINPGSLSVLKNCVGEIGLLEARAEKAYQFEREGYFCRDSRSDKLVFNRTITLRDTFKG